MKPTLYIMPAAALALAISCGRDATSDHSSKPKAEADADAVTVESPLPEDRLRLLKAALPKVAYEPLQAIFASPSTVWYDHASMKPSYQASILESPPMGANANDAWFDLIASSVEPTARNFYDESAKRWRFPFGATAGTDATTNLTVFNFLALPTKNGRLLPLVTYDARRPAGGFTLASWGWKYPVGATVGELLFVTGAGGELLPSEVRIRRREATGWSVNVFRPFPTARALSAAIKARRPAWASDAKLTALVQHLENDGTLVAKRLSASQLPGVFEQDGALDVLPDFGDAALVKELLTETTFQSAYGAEWKRSPDGKVAYAASTRSTPSIVPVNYEAGVIPVSDDSCMRCHKETGKGLTEFKPEFSDIVLYGDMWGRDGIFSFHPFDESRYDEFWHAGTHDNRTTNPKLARQGIVARYDASVHRAPDYPATEVGGGSAGGGERVERVEAGTDVVEFHIKDGTGRGEWNAQREPIRVKPGQTIRIVNDDGTAHVLHTDQDDRPCPHGDIIDKLDRGEHYDCGIPRNAAPGTVFRLWDHYLGSPVSGRFWVEVVE